MGESTARGASRICRQKGDRSAIEVSCLLDLFEEMPSPQVLLSYEAFAIGALLEIAAYRHRDGDRQRLCPRPLPGAGRKRTTTFAWVTIHSSPRGLCASRTAPPPRPRSRDRPGRPASSDTRSSRAVDRHQAHARDTNALRCRPPRRLGNVWTFARQDRSNLRTGRSSPSSRSLESGPAAKRRAYPSRSVLAARHDLDEPHPSGS